MILDVTDATFETDVLVRSQTTPVVVDFWAAWCGPCKTLTPILERVVNETDGAVVLAKVDTERNTQVPMAFRVQSIPSVFGVFGANVVDAFTGAQPEKAVRDFVAKLLDAGSAAQLDSLVAAGDEESLRQAVKIKPDHIPAVANLAELLLGRGDAAGAVEVLNAAGDQAELAELSSRARQQVLPEESAGKINSQLTELLPKVKTDDAAREKFVALLDDLSIGDPAGASSWRRKLSTYLF